MKSPRGYLAELASNEWGGIWFSGGNHIDKTPSPEYQTAKLRYLRLKVITDFGDKVGERMQQCKVFPVIKCAYLGLPLN